MTIRKFLMLMAAVMAMAMTAAGSAQDFPAEFLKMSAMRRQAPPASANAIANYAMAAKLSSETKSAVDSLLAHARAADAKGDASAAQLALAHARVVLAGKAWSPAQVFASSLDFAAKVPLIDVAEPLQLKVARAYATQPVAARLRLTAQLAGGNSVSLGEVPLSLRKSGDTVVTVKLPKGACQRDGLAADPLLAVGDEQGRKSLPLFSLVARDHPHGSHAVRTVSAVAAEC